MSRNKLHINYFKRFLLVAFGVLLVSCNATVLPDCLQNAGPTVRLEVEVPDFDRILVYERVQLIVRQGEEYKVTVETGKYLRKDIKVTVEDGQLILRNNNGCNISRDYGLTKIYVQTPRLTEIRSSTGLTVLSENVLSYPDLTLISEDFGAEGKYHTDGDFDLSVDCGRMNIVTNNLSNLFLRGQVQDLVIGFYAGNSRFEGRELVAQNVQVFHRSSNDMILNVQQSIRGEIRSTGNVVLVQEPPVVEVEQFYKGRLVVE